MCGTLWNASPIWANTPRFCFAMTNPPTVLLTKSGACKLSTGTWTFVWWKVRHLQGRKCLDRFPGRSRRCVDDSGRRSDSNARGIADVSPGASDIPGRLYQREPLGLPDAAPGHEVCEHDRQQILRSSLFVLVGPARQGHPLWHKGALA